MEAEAHKTALAQAAPAPSGLPSASLRQPMASRKADHPSSSGTRALLRLRGRWRLATAPLSKRRVAAARRVAMRALSSNARGNGCRSGR